MWVYCDDTSGNVSKQWNEHNNFPMTPAGLPREEAQKEYNIHFLCTSNSHAHLKCSTESLINWSKSCKI
ncbi:hypothetical protein B0H14DRAFT_2391532 [Mycena olivaceomarginata]|nr:hypothetical protein B0H14DRAFT_2391532 [Mycena olivaceomarginata]